MRLAPFLEQTAICFPYAEVTDWFWHLAKLRKATVGFVMSVCLSVRMDQLGSHWTYFREI
jgi:hypothetical protein